MPEDILKQRNKNKKKQACSCLCFWHNILRTSLCLKCCPSSGLYVWTLGECLDETLGIPIPASGFGFLTLFFQSTTSMEELMPFFNVITLWLIYPVSLWEMWIQFLPLPEGFELPNTQSDLNSKLQYFVGEEDSHSNFLRWPSNMQNQELRRLIALLSGG